MTVPQQRNQKKTKRMRSSPHAHSRKRLLVDERPIEDSETGLSLEEMRGPGSWLENEYFEETFENNLLMAERGRFLKSPGSFLDTDDDFDDDFDNDFDDFDDFG